jgi:predicted transposase/invertase (TIGR01784 family)
VIDTAFDEGKLEGILEGELQGKRAVAKQLKASGVGVEILAQATGLTITEIEQL